MAGMGAGQSQLDYVLKNNNTQISTCIFLLLFALSLSLSLYCVVLLASRSLSVLCGIVGVRKVCMCVCARACVRMCVLAYKRFV